MRPAVMLVKGRNFMFQRKNKEDGSIEVRINDTVVHAATFAVLVQIGNSWCYSLPEREKFWERSNNIDTSQADTHEQAFNDMLAFIRSN